MNLDGLIESRGVQSETVVKTLETMATKATTGVIVGLLVHEGAQQLIERAGAALEDARAALQILEQRRAEFDQAIGQAETICLDAQNEYKKAIAAIERGPSQHPALMTKPRKRRQVAFDAMQAAERDLQQISQVGRGVVRDEIPAAQGEVKRLEALIRELGRIERPDTSDLGRVLDEALKAEILRRDQGDGKEGPGDAANG